ncbi:acyl-CoA dehydrogenase family protein [Sporichthya brevicatena]|uniref:Acyl-CoA dehydrogenase family protein n=1 Tax=Sporichthya brevicatena TaxID=171442 RepID=A0ABP3RR88_9ACTN
MDFTFPSDARQLRERIRGVISDCVPEDFTGAFTGRASDHQVAQQFCKVMASQQLLCMAWPAEYGGQDASVWAQTVVREEMWAHFEPRGAQYMGVNWVGPALMLHGTKEQKKEHLPRIAQGDVIWCQGFSEPDAGSDLFALRTHARARDGGWVIEGQKVWTSYADIAEWCFLLARTSRDPGNKRSGISVFLVPMSAPGVSVRPLKSLVGPRHLNELFFDEVVVGPENLLGTLDEGWRIVLDVLAYERFGIARYAKCDRLLWEARRRTGEQWDSLPGSLRSRWVAALVHTREAQLLAYRVVSEIERGNRSPEVAAAYRIAVTQLDQEVGEVVGEMCGPGVLAPVGSFERSVEDHWRYAQAATVSSGTIEMQRRTLSRGLLGE